MGNAGGGAKQRQILSSALRFFTIAVELPDTALGGGSGC
jgi:hypothetical protein